DERGPDGDDRAEPATCRASADRGVGRTRLLVRAQQRVPRPGSHADVAVDARTRGHAVRDRRHRLRDLRLRAWLRILPRGPGAAHGSRRAPRTGNGVGACRRNRTARVMSTVPDLLIQHGLGVVFAWAFIVQAGVPAPAVPMLLGAGALSGSGRLNLTLAVLAAPASP